MLEISEMSLAEYQSMRDMHDQNYIEDYKLKIVLPSKVKNHSMQMMILNEKRARQPYWHFSSMYFDISKQRKTVDFVKYHIQKKETTTKKQMEM